jgi:23S rRNA pseudouridine2605 synthase
MNNKMERVQKIIAGAGLCSRRKAEELIKQGKVKVNGNIIQLGDQARPEDSVVVSGKEINKEEKKYYLLHKPKAYITTSDDLFGRKKVLDLVPKKPRVFAVGRLDRDATGLLLLTNDGTFANNVMHPSKEIPKTYLVVLDKPFEKNLLEKFQQGIKIDKTLVHAKAILVNDTTIAVTVHVGLHKVVKRLFKELGYYVRKLYRTHVGNLEIDFPVGHYKELTQKDKQLIFEKPNITKEKILKLIAKE